VINVFQPALGPDEVNAVRDVFESGWIGNGPRTLTFERDFADVIGVDPSHVTSVNSCTEAIWLAIDVLGIGPGDEVVLPSISFVGVGNAVAGHGARPVFCDSDRRTLNPTVSHVAAKVSPKTRAVVVLHYGGYPGDTGAIADFCQDRDLILIEDAACALGSRVGRAACGTLGALGAWSFDAMKIVTMGDGGILYARDVAFVERVRRRAHLGMVNDSGMSQAALGQRWWEFEVDSFSRRSIVNDIAAAIGSAQLSRLGTFLARRRQVVELYNEAFAELGWLHLPPRPDNGHEVSNYMYWVQLSEPARDALAWHLYSREIYTTFRYFPLHLIPSFASEGERLPGAERAARTTLCLPLHQSLTDDDVAQVTSAVIEFGRTEGALITGPRD
jgi:aminotransferase